MSTEPSASSIWAKRRELGKLTDAASRIRREIRAMEMERARSKLTRLPPHQRRVLAALVDDDWHEETYYHSFKYIASASGLIRAQVSRACKALRRLGFMEFSRGLFTEDGETAGSGYRVTQAGTDWFWQREMNTAEGSEPEVVAEGTPSPAGSGSSS